MTTHNAQKNTKIIFFGTSDFAVAQLADLIQQFCVVAVVTAPDEPAGRKQILTPPAVKLFAEKNKIPVFQFPKLEIENWKLKIPPADLFIVAAYGKIIPKVILDLPPLGALNVHPSLLPRWRGPSPVQYTLLKGDTETGVTIMLVDEQMDHGPIIANSKFQIPNSKFTYRELHDKLAALGAKLLMETLPKWIAGEIKPIPQDESKATYSRLLKKEDGHIDWSQSAEEIERKIRAFNPWPGTFSFWKRKEIMLRLNIERAEIFAEQLSRARRIGEVFLSQNALCAQTGKGVLRILQLQPEGKKSLDAKTFLNGYADIIGSVLQ